MSEKLQPGYNVFFFNTMSQKSSRENVFVQFKMPIKEIRVHHGRCADGRDCYIGERRKHKPRHASPY